MEFPSQVVSKHILFYFRPNSDRFRTRSGAVRRPCTKNVRNEPIQEMFCVVKHETPPVWRWKLCDFQYKKSISISGLNLIVWRGSERLLTITANFFGMADATIAAKHVLAFTHVRSGLTAKILRVAGKLLLYSNPRPDDAYRHTHIFLKTVHTPTNRPTN